MKSEIAKSIIRNQSARFLKKNSRWDYICPKCGKGEKKGTVGLKYYDTTEGKKYCCPGCKLDEDILGLWKIQQQETDDEKAWQGLFDFFGIDVDDNPNLNQSYQQFLHTLIGNDNPISTGFSNVDNLLQGGLYNGLYIIGARPSIGKTSFVLQIADQIARQGIDVIFVSLEMSKKELIAKSISRLTKLVCIHYFPTRFIKGVSVRDLTVGKYFNSLDDHQKETINLAVEEYQKYSGRIHIVEGQQGFGLEKLKDVIESHLDETGNKPVVFVDYIQILEPFDIKASDKQNIDKTIVGLKRLSRELNIPIFGVSSLNRSNYYTPLKFEAFKESGAIEYGCDVLMGISEETKGSDNDKRLLNIGVLKNRNGACGYSASLFYLPKFNLFVQDL